MIKKITEFKKLSNKKVILRADYNIPIEEGKVDLESSWRIEATLKTIRYLEQNHAKTIILCHLGRPEGNVVEDFRLKPIAAFLAKLLKKHLTVFNNKAAFFPQELQPLTETVYLISNNKTSLPEAMHSGDILMLENIRFHPKEQENDQNFAKQLATIGDIYIDEAFATAHREDASISGLPKLMPSAAGFLMEQEINTLIKIKDEAKKPLIFIMGGAKAETKTNLIQAFLPKCDAVLVGGVLANTILAAQGIAIGKSIIDEEMAKNLNQLEITNPKLHLPVDVIASSSKDGKSPIFIKPVGKLDKDKMILDIGPDTVLLFNAIIKNAETIIWNGPMGYTEVKKFSQGTEKILEAIVNNKKAYKLVGGGESIALLTKHKLLKKIDFVSTGGGALLKFLAGEKLPGIEALKKH